MSALMVVLGVVVGLGSASPPAATTPPPGALATLHRTTCFGSCPGYSLVVYEDGRTEYEGQAWVAEKGARQGSIGRAEVSELRGLIDKLSFDTLPTEYKAWASDLPWTTVCRGGAKPHCVTYEEGQPTAPKALFALADRIDEVTRSRLWIKGPNDSSPPGGALGATMVVSGENAVCPPPSPPTALEEAALAAGRGDADQARTLIGDKASTDAESAFVLTCAELEAGRLDAAQTAVENLQRLAPGRTESLLLAKLVDERRVNPAGSWVNALASAWPSAADKREAPLQVTQIGTRERQIGPTPEQADPPLEDTPTAFLARFATQKGHSSPALVQAAIGVPTKRGQWNSASVRLVALAILRYDLASDAISARGQIVEQLAAQDRSDLTSLAQPTPSVEPFTDEEVARLERAVKAGAPRSHRAELYLALRDALVATHAENARVLAFTGSMSAQMTLSPIVLLPRARATAKIATTEVQRRLSEILQRLGERQLQSLYISDRVTASVYFKLAGSIAGDSALEARGVAVRDQNRSLFRDEARALSLLGWPLKPLQDELLDGLGTDEVNLVQKLNGK